MGLLAHNPLFIVLIVWSIIWKLIALWHAARNGHLTMFIIIAILNTAGVLEIAYLLWLRFRKPRGSQ